MNSPSKSFKISIPSLIDNINIVESFIENACDENKISEDIYGNILIAVTEAVNNAIKHGNKEDRKKLVDLEVESSEQKVTFKIKDEGNGFDFKHLNDPTSPENLEEEGGRGIFLMKHLSDEVNFLEEGRKVELTFYIL
ncbi:MAG: ATP-binding protein [Cytophagales bacterium]|nr:MAG: ATP-binding protein [Cytophagales bacterium]TAH28279.1 MAG: ATP-binding protein [Cytophagales bacterium]